MTRVTDYEDKDARTYEYSDAEYLALSDAVDIPMTLLQRRMYDNEKGEGVVIVCKDCEGNIFKMFTHSVPICNLMRNEAFDDLGGEPMEFMVKKGRSKKSKMDYFYLA